MDQVEEPASTFLRLLSITKKQELKKFCRSAIIQSDDLADTILACKTGLMPWLHFMNRRDFHPDHLNLTDKELETLASHPVGPFSKDGGKVATKIVMMFEERRILVGHLFTTPDLTNWHFFYFDQRDRSERRNHWEAGSHIHVVNYVTHPREKPDALWQGFCSGSLKLSGEHIRFTRVQR
jgi:hypothetical protein